MITITTKQAKRMRAFLAALRNKIDNETIANIIQKDIDELKKQLSNSANRSS